MSKKTLIISIGLGSLLCLTSYGEPYWKIPRELSRANDTFIENLCLSNAYSEELNCRNVAGNELRKKCKLNRAQWKDVLDGSFKCDNISHKQITSYIMANIKCNDIAVAAYIACGTTVREN